MTVASLVWTSSAAAHLGEVVYPIFELPTASLPDLHDGSLEDWEDALPDASLTHDDFQYQGPDESSDPSDLALRVFLAWNHATQRIYVGVERLDDVYLRPSPGTFADRTQFMIDGDHSGGQFMLFGEEYSQEERSRLNFSQAQVYDVRPEIIDGSATPLVARGSSWFDMGGMQIGELPNLSVIEFWLTPWDDLDGRDPEGSRRSVLTAGRIIGFQIFMHDSDETGRLSGEYYLAVPTVFGEIRVGDIVAQHDAFADNFVDGELVPCILDDCSGARNASAILRDSWGRIKSSLAR
ncbi:MAG TPA: hypothetical protein QGF95_17780 [Candidatus Latescibacteria bacterium]|jgi:hypothetical protein|nr:hypothetical protein [Gemmatimonadaceae bacterium]HJP32399.1 hypothetical protein [Candidatus Latescibacterota bacterium]